MTEPLGRDEYVIKATLRISKYLGTLDFLLRQAIMYLRMSPYMSGAADQLEEGAKQARDEFNYGA